MPCGSVCVPGADEFSQARLAEFLEHHGVGKDSVFRQDLHESMRPRTRKDADSDQS